MRHWIKRLIGIAPAPDRHSGDHLQDSSEPDVAGQEPSQSDRYSADQPIRSKAEDRFNRAPFASRIAETIAARTEPSSIVIGLYGAWGDGKTSTLQMMEEDLATRPHVVVVKFNPWHFQSEESLLKGFFATLGSALGRSLPTLKEKIGKAFSDYGSLLSLASFTVGGIIQLRPGDAVKGIGEAMSTVELTELRARIEGILKESGKRVVVLIDDIDRLDRVETHAILKLVKLSASFDFTTYVLAFDDEMVAAAIGDRYGSGGVEAGRGFLEKIIQVPLHLPPPDEMSLRDTAFEGADAALKHAHIALTQAQVDSFVQHYSDGLEPRLETPRQVKLYVNALTFALPLLRGEANPVDVMLMEGVRVLRPKLYAAIRDNPDLFLGEPNQLYNRADQHRQWLDALLDASLVGILEDERRSLRTGFLENLFPRTGTMIYGPEWDKRWAEDQRVCSQEYFKRYFTYAVPPGDVGDSEIATMLRLLPTQTAAQQDDALQAFSRRKAIPKLVKKLRAKEEMVPTETARHLLLAIARNGVLIPEERSPIISNYSRLQAAILVAHLLRLLPVGDERETAATQVAQTSTPLSFALECYRWIRHSDEDPELRRILSPEAERRLERSIVDRIATQAGRVPLFSSEGRDTGSLYWFWNDQARDGSVAAHLSSVFSANGENVDLFLDTFVGEAWDMTTGLPHRADFMRESYNTIAGMIDPLIILNHLRQRHGVEIDTADYYSNDRTPLALRIARQFSVLHRAAMEQQANPDDNATDT
ncbi:NTPase [Ralstonia solanacearum]|nr:NTPase [Ralstonia solanacearum]